MKKRTFFSLIVLSVFILACKKSGTTTNSSYTPSCTGTTPTYTGTVASLIQSNCATSGCHASGSHEGPGALTNYTEIKNASAAIRASVVSGSMPQKSSLSTDQKNSIVCWIDAGALSN